MKELTFPRQFMQVASGYQHLCIESWREKVKTGNLVYTKWHDKCNVNILSTNFDPLVPNTVKERQKKRCLCQETAWVVLITLIKFNHITVPVDPLKSGKSSCSGLLLFSLSLIALSFSKKMSKGVEEGTWSTMVAERSHIKNRSNSHIITKKSEKNYYLKKNKLKKKKISKLMWKIIGKYVFLFFLQ